MTPRRALCRARSQILILVWLAALLRRRLPTPLLRSFASIHQLRANRLADFQFVAVQVSESCWHRGRVGDGRRQNSVAFAQVRRLLYRAACTRRRPSRVETAHRLGHRRQRTESSDCYLRADRPGAHHPIASPILGLVRQPSLLPQHASMTRRAAALSVQSSTQFSKAVGTNRVDLSLTVRPRRVASTRSGSPRRIGCSTRARTRRSCSNPRRMRCRLTSPLADCSSMRRRTGCSPRPMASAACSITDRLHPQDARW